MVKKWKKIGKIPLKNHEKKQRNIIFNLKKKKFKKTWKMFDIIKKMLVFKNTGVWVWVEGVLE